MGYIDKEALLKELRDSLYNDPNMYTSHTEKNIRDDKYSFAIDRIEEAAEVNVRENVEGLFLEMIEDGHYKRICSHCKKDVTKLTSWMVPKFCPHCGAEMNGIVEYY